MNSVKRISAVIYLRKTLYFFCLTCLITTGISAQGTEDKQEDTASLRALVEANPDSLSAHKKYIGAYIKSIPGITFKNRDSGLALLAPQYESWIHQFPHSAIVPFAFGDAYGESPNAKKYLLKAVERNPNLAEAWSDLSGDAERRGDKKGYVTCLQKAAQADPTSPDYAFYYAINFQNSDSARWRRMLDDLIKRFPESYRGAQGLYWLAFGTNQENEKIRIYERLRNLYPPDKFDWSASGMDSYFQLLLKENPVKAMAIAKYMNELKSDNIDKEKWQKNELIAGKIDKAQQLLKKQLAPGAIKMLAGITLSRWNEALETLNLLKAKALAANGNSKGAYNSLILFYAKTPHPDTREALLKYGRNLNKNELQVNDDVWKTRNMTAKTAHPFKLKDYLTEDSVSLSDFRGKVVLLTFWFPGCGPCRGEFPHFQKIIGEFKGENIAYLGINVFPDQNEFVVPFMKGTGHGFTPLESNSDWAQQAYGVRGEPTNFLIDGNGKIIFTGFMIQNAQEEQMLRMMIGSMLTKNKL